VSGLQGICLIEAWGWCRVSGQSLRQPTELAETAEPRISGRSSCSAWSTA